MNKLSTIVLSAVIGAVAAYGTVKTITPTDSQSETNKESVYERIMRTGTIRCGYYVFPPALQIDPKTGEKTGLFVDLFEKIAANLSLKIEWTAEVTFGNMFSELQAGRYDVMCTGAWPDAPSSRVAEFGMPLLYAGVGAYVRSDDTRFDNNLSAINDSSVTVAVMDGDVSQSVASSLFPKAETLSIPQNADATQLEMNVTTKKADVSFIDLNRANQFLEKNPNSIKNAAPNHPVRIYPFAFAVNRGEFELLSMINTTTAELMNSGYIDEVINKWERYPHSFYRVSKPFKSFEESR